MKRFKNILLVFEEGVRGQVALDRAAMLAKRNQARLAVVQVIKDLPIPREARQFISLWHPLLVEDPYEHIVRERQKQLVQSIEWIREREIQGDTKVLLGDPFLDVTREVNHVFICQIGRHPPALKAFDITFGINRRLPKSRGVRSEARW